MTNVISSLSTPMTHLCNLCCRHQLWRNWDIAKAVILQVSRPRHKWAHWLEYKLDFCSCVVVHDEQQFSQKKKSQVCRLCQCQWCKYIHHGDFKFPTWCHWTWTLKSTQSCPQASTNQIPHWIFVPKTFWLRSIFQLIPFLLGNWFPN